MRLEHNAAFNGPWKFKSDRDNYEISFRQRIERPTNHRFLYAQVSSLTGNHEYLTAHLTTGSRVLYHRILSSCSTWTTTLLSSTQVLQLDQYLVWTWLKVGWHLCATFRSDGRPTWLQEVLTSSSELLSSLLWLKKMVLLQSFPVNPIDLLLFFWHHISDVVTSNPMNQHIKVKHNIKRRSVCPPKDNGHAILVVWLRETNQYPTALLDTNTTLFLIYNYHIYIFKHSNTVSQSPVEIITVTK